HPNFAVGRLLRSFLCSQSKSQGADDCGYNSANHGVCSNFIRFAPSDGGAGLKAKKEAVSRAEQNGLFRRSHRRNIVPSASPYGRSPRGRRTLVAAPQCGTAKPAYCGCCLFCAAVASLPTALVIKRTSTRRFFARPAFDAFSATGLSLPNPIT